MSENDQLLCFQLFMVINRSQFGSSRLPWWPPMEQNPSFSSNQSSSESWAHFLLGQTQCFQNPIDSASLSTDNGKRRRWGRCMNLFSLMEGEIVKYGGGGGRWGLGFRAYNLFWGLRPSHHRNVKFALFVHLNVLLFSIKCSTVWSSPGCLSIIVLNLILLFFLLPQPLASKQIPKSLSVCCRLQISPFPALCTDWYTGSCIKYQ